MNDSPHNLDWFTRTCRESLSDANWGRLRISSQWQTDDWSGNRSSPYFLYRLQTLLRNFIRSLNVPTETELRFAKSREINTAAAGFHDAPHSLTRPFIFFNTKLIQSQPQEDLLDVSIGVALHEAGHILYTRDFYLTPLDKEPVLLRTLVNLLEDWRIEELLLEDSPGYRPYIMAVRECLLVKQWFEPAVKEWPNLPDRDRMMLIVAAMVRVPHFLESRKTLCTWEDCYGRCFFAWLREILKEPPQTEKQLRSLANKIFEFIRDHNRRLIQDLESGNFVKGSDGYNRALVEKLTCEQDAMEQETESPKYRKSSLQDLEQWLQHNNAIQEGIDDILASTLASMEKSTNDSRQATFDDHRNGRSDGRKVLVEFVRPDPIATERYNEALAIVKRDSARIRNAFVLPTEKRGGKRRRKLTGQLDSASLYRASFDSRLFFDRSKESESESILVCLVIDESYSMSREGREAKAFEIAVMLNHAFMDHPQIETRIFSHCTNMNYSRVVITDYGNPRQAVKTLPRYRPRQANFDYAAFEEIANSLNSSDTWSRKIMITISDGYPCIPPTPGKSLTDGNSAEETKEVVEHLRTQGWTVLGIGINTTFGKNIYGQDWSIEVHGVKELGNTFFSLLSRLIARALA